MIFQSTDIFPSVVDATEDFNVSCTIKGDVLLSYKISIFNVLTNAVVYNPAKVNLGSPLYNGDTLTFSVPHASSNLVNGIDYYYKIDYFTNNSISSGTAQTVTTTTLTLKSTDTAQKGYYESGRFYCVYNGYTSLITSVNYTNPSAKIVTVKDAWVVSGTSYTIVEMTRSAPVYLKCRSTPTIAIQNNGVDIDNLTTNRCTLTGTYSQAENSTMSYYNLTLYDNSDNSIKSSNNIYSSKISMDVDGLISGESYQAELTVMTQDNVFVTTGKQPFDVNYTVPNISSINVIATADYTKNCIAVDWSGIEDIDGIVSPSDYYMYLEDFVDTGLNGLRLFGSAKTYNDLFALGLTYNQIIALNQTYQELEFYVKYR